MGGEKQAEVLAILLVTGSPPRGRGKDQRFKLAGSQTGITPAWAGKRGGKPGSGSVKGDHPRVGGEKTKKIP